jgi:DNA-binding HxlR family transcriptional regulator
MSPEGEVEGGQALRPCPLFHQAVELIGRRWTGAIVDVLLQRSPLRFSEIAQAVPQLSDRLLSERMKQLEALGMMERTVAAGPPVRVHYSLTDMGRALAPALGELKAWARHWLEEPTTPPNGAVTGAVPASAPPDPAAGRPRAAL